MKKIKNIILSIYEQYLKHLKQMKGFLKEL